MNNVIKNEIELNFPLSRVWAAITDHKQFSEWFRVQISEPFVAGKLASGPILHKGMEHIIWRATIKKIQPESLFSYTWNPYAIDSKIDYSNEKPTLVEFRLSANPKGTHLTLTEKGFDELPEARREEAYSKHVGGWAQQMINITEYLKSH